MSSENYIQAAAQKPASQVYDLLATGAAMTQIASPPKGFNFSRLLRPGLVLLAVTAVVCVVGLAFWLTNAAFFYHLAQKYIAQIRVVFGLNEHLGHALVWVLFAATLLLASYAFSLSSIKRRIGLLGVLTLLVGQSLALWYGTRTDIIGKCYVMTTSPEQPVRYGQQAGAIDQETGRPCRAVTPEMVARLRAYERGERPQQLSERANPTFFDPRTGETIIWYSRVPSGEITLYDLMGFDPVTGNELAPVTQEIIATWRLQQARAMARTPELIGDPDRYQFFDPKTGEPRAWFIKTPSSYDFYDAAGYHPGTGVKLEPVSAQILEEWKKSRLTNCYVITRDKDRPVRYGRNPGQVDPVTGKVCQPLSAHLLERLRLYEKGERPKAVSQKSPIFFDPRTGEPLIWYIRRAGVVELFDLMGFHPTTGDELVPITRSVSEEWVKGQEPQTVPRTPKVVDLKTYPPFDVTTGNARVWYWRTNKGEWEFFDASGFHPRSGEDLKQFTKAIWREYEIWLASQAPPSPPAASLGLSPSVTVPRGNESVVGSRCDALAANPTDQRRTPNTGTAFKELKAHASNAVVACREAIRLHPTELRYQYQLGRALQHVDRSEAFTVQKRLAGLGYAAAYDNLGWLFYFDHDEPEEAVRQFRSGTRLQDPDAMVSLAEMIKRGHTAPRDEAERPTSLYQRAAAMGHEEAAKVLKSGEIDDDVDERRAAFPEESERYRIIQRGMSDMWRRLPQR